MVKKKVEQPIAEEEAPAAEDEQSGADLFDAEVSGAQSLAELAGTGGGSFEGPLVKMESIRDRKHIVLDFKMMPSNFNEGGTFACIQIKMKGELMVVNSNAMVVLKGLAATDKDKLPVPNAFVMRAGRKPGSKPYWDFASAEELKEMD